MHENGLGILDHSVLESRWYDNSFSIDQKQEFYSFPNFVQNQVSFLLTAFTEA
jgi:hypothetical protein